MKATVSLLISIVLPCLVCAQQTPVSPEGDSDLLEGVEVEEGAALVVGVPEEFLDAYFAARPKRFLLDPQGLLKPGELEAREQFLTYHAADAEIDFHLFLFDGEQQIPEAVRTEELVERFFGKGKPSILVLYFLGAPERSITQLSPSIADKVSISERARLLKQSVREAQEHSDPVEQLEAFCTQTAIRVFWIERATGLSESQPTVVPPTQQKLPPEPPRRTTEFVNFFNWLWSEWKIPISSVTGGLLVALTFRWFIRNRARYRFPSHEYEPRLGGDYAAGVGAVVRFGSSTESPSTQKSGPDDVLGGI